jgi:hypothetical protein
MYVVIQHPSKGVLMLPVLQTTLYFFLHVSAVPLASTRPCLDGDLLRTYYPLPSITIHYQSQIFLSVF